MVKRVTSSVNPYKEMAKTYIDCKGSDDRFSLSALSPKNPVRLKTHEGTEPNSECFDDLLSSLSDKDSQDLPDDKLPPDACEPKLEVTSLKTLYLTEEQLVEAIRTWLEKVGTVQALKLADHMRSNSCDMEWVDGKFAILLDGIWRE